MSRFSAIMSAALLAACAESIPGGPSELTVSPTRGRVDRDTEIRLRGKLLFARVFIDYSEGRPDRVARGAQVALGGISLEPLQLMEDESVSAVVPKNFPIGVHDLEVIDPDGRLGLIEDAFEVYRPGCDELPADAAGCFSPCGDGALDEGEACDDGNKDGGDGCSSACMLESGFTCVSVRHSRGTMCVRDSETVFVDSDRCGATETGAKDAPFCQLTSAIAPASEQTILVRNAERVYEGGIALDLGTYRIIAEKNATMVHNVDTVPAIDVRSGDALIYGLWIISAGDGVHVQGGARARIFGDAIFGARFAPGGGGVGVVARAGANLELEGNLIAGHQDGGVLVETGTYRVESNVISENGHSGSGMGGVKLTAAPEAGSRFVFNTIVANGVAGGSQAAAGVECAPGTTLEATLVHGNSIREEFASRPSGVSDACTLMRSAVDFGADGGFRDDPLLDAVDQEHHVLPGSPLINRAEDIAPGSVDFDGDRRPAGGASDIGADEAA